MKKVLSIMLSIVIIALIVSCGGSKQSDTNAPNNEPAKIRVAYMADFSGTSAAAIAQEKGYFKDENLEVELVKFLNGPSEIAAMLSGDIQFAYIGHGAHSLAIQGKVNVLFPNGLSKSEQLLVGNWANINSIADLKGKTIGTQLGTSGEILLDLALKREGIKRNEVNVINMDVSGIIASMVGKKVDAVSVWAPHTFEIYKQISNDIKSIASIIDYQEDGVFPSSWVVTPDYQNKNEEIVKRFSRALFKAMDDRSANLDEAVEIVAKINGTPVEAVASEKETGLWLTGKEVKDAYANGTAINWYESQQKIFLNSKVVDAPVNVTNYVEIDFINNIDK